MQSTYHAIESVATPPLMRAIFEANRRNFRAYTRGRQAAVAAFDAQPRRRHILLTGDVRDYAPFFDDNGAAARRAYDAGRITVACQIVRSQGAVTRLLVPALVDCGEASEAVARQWFDRWNDRANPEAEFIARDVLWTGWVRESPRAIRESICTNKICTDLLN